jgi:hypothetical protein
MLGSTQWEGVYASPWWELWADRQDSFAWKRAILRRAPGAGATHWGHLYVVVSPLGTRGNLPRTESTDRSAALPPVEIGKFATSQATASLWVRPREPEALNAFVAALARRLGVDAPSP